MIYPRLVIPTHSAPMNSRGFTLIELLLAVSITGVIAVVLFASLSLGFDMRRQGQRKLSDRGAARLAVELMAEDIASTPPPTGVMAGEWVGEDATGPDALAADVLTCITANPALPTDKELGDLRKVAWRLVDDPAMEGQLQLVREVTTNLLAPVTPAPTQQVIARRVLGLNIRYDDGAEWIDAWDSGDRDNALPRAIEITLIIQPEHHIQRVDNRLLDEDEQSTLTIRRIVMLPTSTTAGAATRG